MPVQVSFPSDNRSVVPGEQIVLRATVQNPGRDTEAYTVVPWGLNGSWLTVDEPSITLFGGTSKTIDVVVRPPRVWSTSAGTYDVEIRVVPHRDPLAAMSAVAVVEVDGFEHVDVVVTPPERWLHRRSRFDIEITNSGNRAANCRVSFASHSGELDGILDPPLLAVSPGSHGTVRLKVKARNSRFRRDDRSVDFDVAVALRGHADRIGVLKSSGTAHLLPTLSTERVRDLVARSTLVKVAAFAVIVGFGWWFVVEPWIQRRVDDGVERRIATEDRSVSGVEGSGESVPFAIVLSPRATADAPAVDRYHNSIGADLSIDELVLKSSDADAGTAVLTIGDEVVRRWNLATVSDSAEFDVLDPPVDLPAEQAIALSVDCDRGSGEPCQTALVLVVRRTAP